MKATAILLGLVLSASTGFAQQQLPRHKQPKQYKGDPDVWNVTYNDGLPLRYVQAKETLETLEKDAALKMWSAERLAEEKAKVSAGGLLQITYNRNQLAKAKPENLTIIIQDAQGKELQRYEPKPGVPDLRSVGGNPVYMTTVYVPLTAPLPPDSKVFVADSFEQLRFEYLIRPL